MCNTWFVNIILWATVELQSATEWVLILCTSNDNIDPNNHFITYLNCRYFIVGFCAVIISIDSCKKNVTPVR